METFETVTAAREWVARRREFGTAIHLVPTMGYLHEGHLSLMRQAKADGGDVVISIFVNPRQFGPTEDLRVYPRDLPRDSALAADAGVAAIFAPTVAEMYPPNFRTKVVIEYLATGLCGAFRPGHFEGVATVVLKLFNIIQPDAAYFGKKDYQQLKVIERLTADLNLPIRIVGCEIVREADGLAMSSRNVFLSADERVQASALNKAISRAQQMVRAGERDVKSLVGQVTQWIEREPLARAQYIEVVSTSNLAPVETIENEALLAVAVFVGKTRLIDNGVLQV